MEEVKWEAGISKKECRKGRVGEIRTRQNSSVKKQNKKVKWLESNEILGGREGKRDRTERKTVCGEKERENKTNERMTKRRRIKRKRRTN